MRRGAWSEGGKIVLNAPSAKDILRAVGAATKDKGRPVFSDEIELRRSSSSAKRRMLEQLVARGMIEVTLYRRVIISEAENDAEVERLIPKIPGVFIDWRYPHIRSRAGRSMFSLTQRGEAAWRRRRSFRDARRPGVKDAINAAQSEAEARFAAWFNAGLRSPSTGAN